MAAPSSSSSSSLQPPPSLPERPATLMSHYVSSYVAGKEEEDWKTRVTVAWNDLVHVPVVEDLCWCAFWLVQLLFLTPLYAAGLVLLFLWDCLTGAVLPRLKEPQGRAVIITGCDSGFGRDLALALYERGWRVYACCLTDAGASDLTERCSGDGMVAVQVDVTKQADVDRVVALVGREARGKLFALVNNAGIGRGGIVDWMPMSGAYCAWFSPTLVWFCWTSSLERLWPA